MRISSLVSRIGKKVPFRLAEKWDNVGLTIGEGSAELSSVVVCLDLTDEVIDHAKKVSANLIISHHPLIFGSINSINPNTLTGSLIYRLIRENINLLVLHTNFDKSDYNSSYKLASQLGIAAIHPLHITDHEYLHKIAVFVPNADREAVKKAMSAAGAGVLGNYSECAYMMEGFGEFRGNENSNPAIGSPAKLERVEETRLEMIFPESIMSQVVEAMKNSHPYEEPAYDLYQLKNVSRHYGYGIYGDLSKPLSPEEFIARIKHVFGEAEPMLKIGTPPAKIKKVALVNGSGFEFHKDAAEKKCDVFLTGDISYHRACELKHKGLFTIDCTHFATEKNFVNCVSDLLNEINHEAKWTINYYPAECLKNPMERI